MRQVASADKLEKNGDWTTLHFKIDGEWFTWWLRHLWAEGSYAKAMKTWAAAFPVYDEAKYYKTIFLQVVSGKKKFPFIDGCQRPGCRNTCPDKLNCGFEVP